MDSKKGLYHQTFFNQELSGMGPPSWILMYRLSLRQLALLFSKVKHEGLYAAWIYQDAPSMHNKFL